jgi:hypothetical protein
VILQRSDWELVLKKGDTVLGIHIPRDGRMSHDICGESMCRAKEFYARYFPDRPVSAFTCFTWLFDFQLQKMLPDSSNIVSFQREFYLFPDPADGSDAVEIVFGEKNIDFSKAPGNTLLRRKIIEHIKAGGYLHDSGGFIIYSDLNWGVKIYQRGEYGLET